MRPRRPRSTPTSKRSRSSPSSQRRLTVTRRGAGEGSITLRTDGRYMARVDLGWVDGKRLRKVVYGSKGGSKKEIIAKLDQERAKTAAGVGLTGGSGTVRECLLGWLEAKHGRVAPGTYDLYTNYVNKHLMSGLGQIKLDKLTPEQVDRFFAASTLGPWAKIHCRRA